jgi:ethanolamine utilization protein EutN
MDLARVEGTVVSTVKVDRLRGHKLLVVAFLGPDAKPVGGHVVAVDTVGSGVGEVVLIVRGSSARQTSRTAEVPTDTTIVGIVDAVVYRGKKTYEKSALGTARESGKN